MNRGSLRLRLLLAGVVSIIAALTLSTIGLAVLFERHVERRVEAELGVYLDQIIAGFDRHADGTFTISRAPADPRFDKPLSGLYWQIRTDKAILRSRSLWDEVLALPADELADGAAHRHRIEGPKGDPLIALERSVAMPARMSDGAVRAVVAVEASNVASAVNAFATDLLPYVSVIAAFLIVASYAQVAIGLRPLTAVRHRIASIREGKARRLGEAFPDEILPLAAEVDALLEARDRQIEMARARAGDLAHGLKTPLQVLVGDVERLRKKGETDIADEIDHVATAMRRHVDRELARARIAFGSLDAHCAVAEVVNRVVAVVARTPLGARIEWSTDIPVEIAARIDPDDFAEAIGNLIENAARHARSHVSIRAREGTGFTIVTVVDDGPGITPERLGHALLRGGRLDTSGDGAGLGLSIVGDIAEAWGGHLELRNGESGLEASFTVKS